LPWLVCGTTTRTGLAALFGFAAACILYFHFFFVVILSAFVICFLAVKIGDRRILWRLGTIALSALALGSKFVVVPQTQCSFDETRSRALTIL
jgi:hypothetical protein